MKEADDCNDLFFFLQIMPHQEFWRELMLDLGAPLNAEWEISVSVQVGKLRDDVPYDVTEMVSIQDYSRWRSGEEIGTTSVSESNLELFLPVYVMRTRVFLLDNKPTLEDLGLSAMLPDMPFFEMKRQRIAPSGRSSMSFRFEAVPPDKCAAEFLKHLRWDEVLSGLYSGDPDRGRHLVEQIHPDMQDAIVKRTQGGDWRSEEIKQMWADDEVLKNFARKVDEVWPIWTTIKGMADSCSSREEEEEWLSGMLERPLIQGFMSLYPMLTKDVMCRAVDSSLKPVDREDFYLASYHAALEVEAKINNERLSIIDAYRKYQDRSLASSSLKPYYRKGKALLS